jgi:hypothetical protein
MMADGLGWKLLCILALDWTDSGYQPATVDGSDGF